MEQAKDPVVDGASTGAAGREETDALSPREDERLKESIRGMLLETINIAFREYGVKGLRHFRDRVTTAKTLQEVLVARDMLLTIGRFHDSTCRESTYASPN